MGEVNTSQWIQFFRNAGMPLNVAANYAIIFYDNRIQLDMLMDLSKEYLYDMGIRVMGDVIAILRYAKEYHNQMVKEKMIGQPSVPFAKTQSSPTTRILSHYTRPSNVNRKSSQLVQRVDSAVTGFASVSRREPQAASALTAKRTLVNLSQSVSQGQSPIKKARFFQQQPQLEEEKSMVVRMPSGSTERSRKLLHLQQQMQSMKRSVFDRLGDSHVSSSTDVKFSKNIPSVFNRLGPSSSTGEVTSTAGKMEDDNSRPLQYKGVLKTLSTVKTTRTIQKNSSSLVTKSINFPGKKIIRLKQLPQAGPRSSASRRTVVQSAKDLQTSNVSQINKILTQNIIRTSEAKQVFRPTFGVQNNRGRRGGFSNRSAAITRIGLAKKQLQQQSRTQNSVSVVRGRGRVISLRNTTGSKFAQNNKQSVFNRLGK